MRRLAVVLGALAATSQAVEVSVCGDATYELPQDRGVVCASADPIPPGTACPLKGDKASADCFENLPSYASGACVAPEDAVCALVTDSTWGCVLPSVGCGGKTLTTAAPETEEKVCETWDYDEGDSGASVDMDALFDGNEDYDESWFVEVIKVTELFACGVDKPTPAPTTEPTPAPTSDADTSSFEDSAAQADSTDASASEPTPAPSDATDASSADTADSSTSDATPAPTDTTEPLDSAESSSSDTTESAAESPTPAPTDASESNPTQSDIEESSETDTSESSAASPTPEPTDTTDSSESDPMRSDIEEGSASDTADSSEAPAPTSDSEDSTTDTTDTSTTEGSDASTPEVTPAATKSERSVDTENSGATEVAGDARTPTKQSTTFTDVLLLSEPSNFLATLKPADIPEEPKVYDKPSRV